MESIDLSTLQSDMDKALEEVEKESFMPGVQDAYCSEFRIQQTEKAPMAIFEIAGMDKNKGGKFEHLFWLERGGEGFMHLARFMKNLGHVGTIDMSDLKGQCQALLNKVFTAKFVQKRDGDGFWINNIRLSGRKQKIIDEEVPF